MGTLSWALTYCYWHIRALYREHTAQKGGKFTVDAMAPSRQKNTQHGFEVFWVVEHLHSLFFFWLLDIRSQSFARSLYLDASLSQAAAAFPPKFSHCMEVNYKALTAVQSQCSLSAPCSLDHVCTSCSAGENPNQWECEPILPNVHSRMKTSCWIVKWGEWGKFKPDCRTNLRALPKRMWHRR